jgi:phage tail sheath protein FI
MPEYLSPAVYVEEVELGPKPIEGVSTSTAGMVGDAERGPESVPVLVTSLPEFQRLYGGYLDRRDYQGAAGEGTWYLPHSVEGFFQNGGQRVYVVRVASDSAIAADVVLMDRGAATGFESSLLGRAQMGDTFLVLPDTPPLTGGELLRIGDGATTEYSRVGTAAQLAATVFANRVRALRAPAYATYTTGTATLTRALTAVGGAGAYGDALADASPIGANRIRAGALPAAPNQLVANQILMIGDAADPYREFAIVDSVPDPTDTTVRLRHRLAYAHPAGAKVVRVEESGASAAGVLSQGVSSGDGIAVVSAAGPQAVIRLGGLPTVDLRASYYVVAPVGGFRLRQPVMREHPVGEPVTQLTFAAPGAGDPLVLNTTLNAASAAGDTTVRLAVRGNLASGQWISLGGVNPETAQVASVPVTPADAVIVRQPLRFAHANGATVTRMRRQFALAAAAATDSLFFTTTTAAPATVVGDTAITLTAIGNLAVDQWLQIESGGANPEFAQVASIPALASDPVVLRDPLRFPHAAGVNVVRQNDNTPHTALLEPVPIGGVTVLLADNTAAFAPGTFVEVGPPTSATREMVELSNAVTAAIVPLAAGASLAFAHPVDSALRARAELFRVRALDRGAWGNELRVKIEDEDPAVVQTTVATTTAAASDVPLESTSGIEPGSLLEILDFSAQLAGFAPAGVTQLTLSDATGLVIGDRLRIGRADPEFGTIVSLPATPNTIVISPPLRRSHGTREPVDRMDATGQPPMAKVMARIGANQVRFDAGGLTFPVTQGWVARSRDFSLTVEQVKRGRANPRTPGIERLENVEVFRHLSLDARHSRYIGKVIGSTVNPLRLWDRRPEGESDLVRVEDPLFPLFPSGADNTQAATRPGPDLIYEILPGGRRRPVGRWLVNGDSDDAGVTDTTYRGQDNIDPLQRTGLMSLKNQEDISLVSVPGRVSAFLQGEVINHCELMRYRFAVLDSVPGDTPTGARLPDVTAQRQQFDTKYASLYYPWLQLRDPFPDNAAQPGTVAVPPSGHVTGIYARSDVRRGVQKAPANEVIAGIQGLQRALTKGEHDILNPGPVNINVLRDFRDHNRGLRVWGARVISSDFEWKYVNVRRLFNYIERSLEIGTQWVVFEPNDEHLWARVRRSIADFLTVVWHEGGLMGTKAEEAFFVKCDRTTMTQLDIDSGRLIILVGIAPVKPAEFVIIRIGQYQGGSSVAEL